MFGSISIYTIYTYIVLYKHEALGGLGALGESECPVYPVLGTALNGNIHRYTHYVQVVRRIFFQTKTLSEDIENPFRNPGSPRIKRALYMCVFMCVCIRICNRVRG